ncbi:UNKNOWN [Stylonychia lemnae]|uniref:Ion transport domain-containing protein n=1 Tax=Stylonychia lemnae TaxID=5949 RepID=A0A077ZWH6_STYLE|nr:UNKNOWN [Stylonychia lemnae]|eukprot:CDW73620.1 UNKNOWN [Stylonychia lemnae]
MLFMISLVFEIYHATFHAFFLIFIIQFGLIFTVLFKAAPIEEYEGVSAFGYYLMIFRIAAGDFATDNYKDQSQYLVILTWIVWVIAVIALNVVFMNFIIAVISESYEKVMQKIVAESYKVKVHMIKEREQFFTNQNQIKEAYFPQYLVLRRPHLGEWQGFIKDLKSTMKTTVAKSRNDIIQSLAANQQQIQILKNDLNSFEKRIDSKTQANHDELKSQMAQLHKLMTEKFGGI